MTKSHWTIALLSIFALGCGEGDAGYETTPGADTAGTDAAEGDSGLPVDSVSFEPVEGRASEGLTGTLWLATSQPQGAEGVSLVAQLQGVPAEQAYSWALHRGSCGDADNVILPLGYGTEAVDEDTERTLQGGPLGQTRAAFEPTLDGRVEATVWVPLDGQLSRSELEGSPHTLRIHPDAGAGELEPSVACARIPQLPTG